MGKTVAEKIFDAHRIDNPSDDIHVLRLDAVFCHEITTPTAINDLIARGKDRVFDPQKIKAVIDHVTPAKDSKTATQGKILRDWARRHKIHDFFDIRNRGAEPAQHDRGTGGNPPGRFHHDLDLLKVRQNGADADNIISHGHFLFKPLQGGEIKHRGGGIKIVGNSVKAKGIHKRPHGIDALVLGQLIMVKFDF